MGMDLTGFDANTVEPNAPREVVPVGWYKGVIIDTQDVTNKAQNGSFLQIKVEFVDGQFSGRVLTDRLNLQNPSDDAVRIAQGTLSAICRAVGVMTPRDSSDLHDKPLMFHVRIKPAEGNYGPQNEIDGYDAIGGKLSKGGNGAASPAKTAATQTAAPQEATSEAAGGKQPPWRKGKK